MSEAAQGLGWLYTTLHGDSALLTAAPGDVWRAMAPVNTTPPFVVIARQGGADVLTMNAYRLFASTLMQVKVVGPASGYSALVTAANRIDALIGRTGPIALSQGGILACYREQEIAYDENIDGVLWAHLGGLYRLEIQGS